jgi:predicted metal-dependent peptidase
MDIVRDALLAARCERPYYARAIAALRPVEAPGLGTVGVDKWWRLYVDLEWFSQLTPAQRSHLICAHEIEHLLRGHPARGVHHDRKAWLVAADAEINDDADLAKLPDHPVLPSSLGRPDGLLAEDYVDAAAAMVGLCGGGSGSGGESLEQELSPDGDESAVTEDAAEALRDQVAADVRAHVEANGRGSVPSGVEVWANMRKPAPVAIPWTTALSGLLCRIRREITRGREDYSRRHLSRRQRDGECLRPAMVAYQPKIGIIVDTSGSMADRGQAAVGVALSLIRKFSLTTVYACDAKVQGTSRRMPRAWRGGGGTDLRVAMEASAGNDATVVITDGETPWPKAPLGDGPVVAIVIDSSVTVPAWCRDIRVQSARP